jgi:hypothetical protein
MKAVRAMLLVLMLLLWSDAGCLAQGNGLASAKWETRAVDKLGPQEAAGLLLYIYEQGDGAVERSVPRIFVTMARVVKWDILRVDVQPSGDIAAQEAVLRFVGDQISAAHGDGYKEIVVAGLHRGGWFALAASTLPRVDAVIGLAPAAAAADALERERVHGQFAPLLTAPKARRIAAFFFAENLQEDERRAVTLRRVLRDTPAAYMVIDRPPDFQGDGAGATGRFARRYRDCLLQFVRSANQISGETSCDTSVGYAAGGDIGFPAVHSSKTFPRNGNLAFAPFWARWEGDSEDGDYLIVQAIDVGPRGLRFRLGFSPMPGSKAPPERRLRVVDFDFDTTHHRMLYTPWPSLDLVALRLKSATELDYRVRYAKTGNRDWGSPRMLLRRRID